MSNHAKDIRKQLKNVAQDLAPTVLASEAGVQMYKLLMQAVEGKLKDLELQVQETLIKIDERSKDLQAYAMRQISAMTPAPTINVQEGNTNEEQATQPKNPSDQRSALSLPAQGHSGLPEGNQE